MTDILRHIYNACNPLEPATEEYWVESASVRGSYAVAEQYQRDLSLSNGYHRMLFSGHVGCGKSSELQNLCRRLNDANPPDPCKRYFPILMSASDYLDDYDVTPTDILLAIVSEVAATLREHVGIELKDSYWQKRWNEIRGLLLTDVNISEGEVSLGEAKAKIQLLKEDPTTRTKVREALLPQMTSVLQEINAVFDEARTKLKSHAIPKNEEPYTDFVLIVDDLEKIQRVDGAGEGSASHQQLFIERAPQLTALRANIILTIPLALIRSHGPQLRSIYGTAPVVLPMIKVHPRGETGFYEPGRRCLASLLERRAHGFQVGDIIQSEALDWLIRYSGGDVRYFMANIQRAATYVDNAPITLTAAKRAMSQEVALFSTSIRTDDWKKLAALDASDDQWVDNNDPGIRKLLEQNCILEYVNGGIKDEVVEEAEPWYGVHPLVRELSQFKRAKAK
jgi:hypothetical protein